MAYRDYLHCSVCDCKLIYDGDDNARESFGIQFGEGATPILICPNCISGKVTPKLIAASPDLLEALKALLERYTGLVNSGDAGNWDCEKEDEVKYARQAIAKAEGNTDHIPDAGKMVDILDTQADKV